MNRVTVRPSGRHPGGGPIAEPAPLFVCGCARSGTTALAQLVGSDRRVLLGIERYAKLARDRFAIGPEHLEPARFARIEDGDTFYDSFDGRHYWDAHFADKLAGRLELAYVGDKKPILYRFWRELFQRFPDARLLFIYRDPLAVARSWERRARVPGGNWPRARDAGAAMVTIHGRTMEDRYKRPADWDVIAQVVADGAGSGVGPWRATWWTSTACA